MRQRVPFLRRPLLESLESRVLLAATVDLLAVYTPQAQSVSGGVSGILSKIRADVAATNTVLANSRVPVTVRLVGASSVSYTESGDYGLDLDRMDFVNDGYLDTVPSLQQYFRADAVILFASSSDPQNVGISYELNPSSPTRADDAYGVVDVTSATNEYVLAHELGHTWGAAHAAGDPGGGGVTSYAAGYRFTGNDGVVYHDVMAYSPGQQIPYFSNPNIFYAGVPIGSASANASATIAQFAPLVSTFQPTPGVIGNLDTANATAITGWMVDPKANTSIGKVRIVIDGVTRATINAGGNRPDLLTFLGSANHGFTYATPTLPTGTHTVSAYGIDIATGAQTLLGTKTFTISAPAGVVDFADARTVSGWALDPQSPASSITVYVEVDGFGVGTTTANLARPDLVPRYGSANHGFRLNLPATMPAGIHRVDVFALQIGTGKKFLLGSRVVSTNTAPRGVIDNASSTTIQGWAYSADVGPGAIQVRYTIDNFVPVFLDANLPRPDLIPSIGSANHGFSIALPTLTAGKHTIKVDAVDTLTRAITTLGTRTITIADTIGAKLPVGALDIANNGRIAGWTLDPDDPAQPINLRIDIDGVVGTPFLANLSRPDLIPSYGSANHGFSVNPALSAGAHNIDVYAIDPDAGPVLIASRTTVTAPPRGWVDVLNANTIAGWAFAPALAGAPAKIRVDVDGKIGSLVTANVSRPDLAPSLGGTNFGFSLSTFHIASGRHAINVYVLNPVTDDLVLIGSKVVTFA